MLYGILKSLFNEKTFIRGRNSHLLRTMKQFETANLLHVQIKNFMTAYRVLYVSVLISYIDFVYLISLSDANFNFIKELIGSYKRFSKIVTYYF